MSISRRKRNWALNVPMRPANVVRPRSTDEIHEALQKCVRKGHRVKVVGSRHTCSDLVRMQDDVTLVSLDGMPHQDPVIDAPNMSVTVPAQMSLHDLNRYLWKRGYALENLGDIDRQTVAGAISTGTHGSGSGIGSLSSQVTGVEIVTPALGLIECPTYNKAFLDAVRLSLGCLGVITSVTMKIQERYWLRMVTTKESRGEVMSQIDELLQKHRHVECWVWPHTCLVSLRKTDPAETPKSRGSLSRFWKHTVLENGGLWCVSSICRKWQSNCDEISMLSAALLRDDETDVSYRVLATPRRVKYLEMEYVVPHDDGPACLEQVMRLLDKRKFPVSFPLHYRYTAADSIYLSPFYNRAGASIDVQQFRKMDYLDYFRESERIFLKHEGRPHWGKLHFKNGADLKSMYPMWDTFLDVREQLDPMGVFLTPYLRDLLGV